MTTSPRFSLVVPVYLNATGIEALLTACGSLSEKCEGGLECIFVVDGSPDDSYARLISGLETRSLCATVLLHSRNFGSFQAIRTGLEHARGRAIAVMAADLQEPPDLVLEFLRRVEAGSEVVCGVREGRADPFVARVMSGTFWWLYRRMIVPEVPEGGVDVFAVASHVRDALVSMNEANSSLIAQLFWVGYQREFVGYTRLRREHGVSAWTLRKKLKYLSDSVFAFTDLPVRLLTAIGGLAVVASVVLSVLVLSARLLGLIQVAGYTPTVLAVAFFGGLNALGLGIVGMYVWRAYENTKQRPLALLRGSATRAFPRGDDSA